MMPEHNASTFQTAYEDRRHEYHGRERPFSCAHADMYPRDVVTFVYPRDYPSPLDRAVLLPISRRLTVALNAQER
jgi:hypothetical protein